MLTSCILLYLLYLQSTLHTMYVWNESIFIIHTILDWAVIIMIACIC